MKGITPVIAIVLLLMITIALIGFAYVWFNRMALGLGGTIERQSNQTMTQMGEAITITSCDVSGKTVYVKNTGSSTLDPSQIDVYVEGALGVSGCSGGAAPGDTATCSISIDLASGNKVRAVTGSGAFDETVCP